MKTWLLVNIYEVTDITIQHRFMKTSVICLSYKSTYFSSLFVCRLQLVHGQSRGSENVIVAVKIVTLY